MSKPTFKRKSQFFAKINISDIVKNHYSTLKDYNVSSHSVVDILLFFIFPLLFSILVVYLKISLNKDLIGILINVFSIFTGLLFNLLILVYDVISKVPKSSNNAPSNRLKVDMLEQIYFNISFEILLSLFVVILLSIAGLFASSNIVNLIFSVVVFFLIITFTLTLLMVLKRVNKLLSHEIEQQKNSIS